MCTPRVCSLMPTSARPVFSRHGGLQDFAGHSAVVAVALGRGFVRRYRPYHGYNHPMQMLIALLLAVQTGAAVPAPPDVAAPPADATKTASGLATKVLAKASGTDHPTKDDLVTVHYTGWTTDGKMFDSSVGKGAPST